MKKNMVYILVIVLALGAFTGCKKKAGDSDNIKDNNVISPDNNETDDDKEDPSDEIEDNEDAAEGNHENDSEDATEDTENGNTVDVEDSELTAIIKKIYEVKDPGLMLAETAVDLSNSDSVKYYTGLSDASKIKEAVASETMIGSQAYSLVLVQLNDEKDAKTVADEMKKGIDTRKWICVGADDLQVVSHDDVIMLFMVSSSLKDNVTSEQMVDAFEKVCDNGLGVE